MGIKKQTRRRFLSARARVDGGVSVVVIYIASVCCVGVSPNRAAVVFVSRARDDAYTQNWSSFAFNRNRFVTFRNSVVGLESFKR